MTHPRVKFFGGPVDGAVLDPDPGVPALHVYLWLPDENGEFTRKSKHDYRRWDMSPYYVYNGWK